MDLLKCPLPKGWTVQLNSDGSYGIHGPIPERSATPVRTSHALYPSDKSDLGELVRRMCQDALTQSATATPPTRAEITRMAEILITAPEIMLQIISIVNAKLGQPSDKEDPCAPTL